MRKNILFIAHDSSLYGANQSLINMISSIKENNDIRIYTVFPSFGPICNKFDALGWSYQIILFRTDLRGPNNTILDIFKNFLRLIVRIIINKISVYKFKDLIISKGINIIHSNSSVISIGLKLSIRYEIKHIWHLREFIDPNHGLYVFGGIRKLSKIYAKNNTICISKSLARHYDIEETTSLIYDAVRGDIKERYNKTKSNYFVYCGSLTKHKGIEDALYAFSHLLQCNPNYKLFVAGTGNIDYVSFLHQLTRKYSISNNTFFLGFYEDIDNLMSNAIAVLMCSKNEALGRVTIEAMLNRCIVIGYNSTGTAELIQNGITGFLYDSTKELTDLLKFVIDENSDFENIRNNAYKYASSIFTEKAFKEKLLYVYNSILS